MLWVLNVLDFLTLEHSIKLDRSLYWSRKSLSCTPVLPNDARGDCSNTVMSRHLLTSRQTGHATAWPQFLEPYMFLDYVL